MKIKTLNYLSFLFALVFILMNMQAVAQLLAVSGKKIINTSNNQEVILNAMNLGNWMVMEGYMMNSVSQAPDQHTWKKKLTTLIGSANVKTFYDAWLNNFVTLSDINQIKSWGINAVRVPLHYEYFINAGTPDVWNNQGFTLLDNIVTWCSNAGIYVIIDLHAAPGGQSNGAICDYDNSKPSLWESSVNKSKTVKLWRKLSERYKTKFWVAGYDLLNEPAWNLPNGTELKKLYKRITDTIRSAGDNHILFIEGNWYSNDFTGLTPAWDNNLVYVFHKYWSDASVEDIKWILDFRNTWNRPIWCGEHGENSNDHFTKIVEIFNAHGIGMSWWTLKKFESINDFLDAKFPVGYQDLLNYFGGNNPTLNPTTGFYIVMQLAEKVKFSNCNIQSEVLRSVFTQPGKRDTEPFSENLIPGKLYTPNYDKGMNGYAYSDQAWEDVRLTTGYYTAWNNGWVYRNNGVDLQPTTDSASNGYTVAWFNRGEWMNYTVNVTIPGTYLIEFRVANGNSQNGTVQIQNSDGTELLASANVPSTGSWSNWTTVNAIGGFLTAGLQQIRVFNAAGEFNISSINFIFQDSILPQVISIPRTQKVINLKGNNGYYVTFSGPDNLLSCAKVWPGSNEEFVLVELDDGQMALKGSNNKYVTVNGSNGKLYCNASQISTNEKFTIKDLCGALSLKGYNGLYVSSNDGASTGMTCNRVTPQAWEYFNWTYLRDIDAISGKTEKFRLSGFKVFPNPAHNTIHVSSEATVFNGRILIAVYNLDGKMLIQFNMIEPLASIDLSGFPAGIYMLKIIESGRSFSMKFIKTE